MTRPDEDDPTTRYQGPEQGVVGYPPPQGYPAPYGQQAQGYSPYGYQVPRGPSRPGGATASAVLMFIQAGLTLVSTFYVLFGASVAGTVAAGGYSSADALQTEWTVIGILQLVSVGLLIFGGVQLLGSSGVTVAIVACAAQLLLVIYWMIRIGTLADFNSDGEPFYFVIPLIYAVLPAVALPLIANKNVTRYMAAKRAQSATAS